MRVSKKEWGTVYEVDVLIMGTGASGVGAALKAAEMGADVLLVGKGTLEGSGSLGGGNDHFMAALGTDEPHDDKETFINFYMKSAFGYKREQLSQWYDAFAPCLAVLDEVGTEFKPDGRGGRYRSIGFGQPGAWWLHIVNGRSIKRNLAKKVRSLNVNVLDDIQFTSFLAKDGKFNGCTGFNILTGEVCVILCKTGINSLGWHCQRVTNNSTGNPFNCWFTPFTTGSYFTLPYAIGATLINMDISGRATMLPKGWGAPGMNGINNMGGHELNALGERFMGKYDPMMENGKRRNQVMGTQQELVEGNGPPFYMDMRHFSPEDAHHLQYVLMPADKETYLDYCAARGIEFSKYPLEVEVGELSLSGMLLADERMETTVKGLFAGCNFTSFSGAMCGGYVAAGHAVEAAASYAMGELDESAALTEKARLLSPLANDSKQALGWHEFENPIRQVMDYYAKYRRNMPGMALALEKLDLIDSYRNKVKADNLHELMRLHEAFDLLVLCRLHLQSCLQRKESGRGMYMLADYPELDPNQARALSIRQENGQAVCAWAE
ncbi:FAD-binding protein [Desulfovibrio sp. OttesenSCG-928-C06]|nr:FAD-binding protein [Desulfovibrio sp. OttesenSCG-928-C06]